MSDDDGIEIWLDIQDFHGYQVSNFGRVRSRRKTSPGGMRNEWRLMRQRKIPKTGHHYVSLRPGDGKTHVRYVHRLVLESFVGPCPLGMECCHQDDNPSNNALENLRWDTHAANSADALRNGRLRNRNCVRGNQHSSATVTDEVVIAIRRRYADGATIASLAREFSTTSRIVFCIVHRNTWKHLP